MTLVMIQVDGLPEGLLLCPDSEADEWRKKLETRGNPGRLWTHTEVHLLKSQGATPEEARKIAEARMLLKADRMWVRPAKQEAEQMKLA